MPIGPTGFSHKWFYERARGQYSTHLRPMSVSKQNKFIAEYPKNQVFTKTDMAKYENTWRMRPHEVKKGAQANLKLLGQVILKEFEADEETFGAAYYNDLVAKMILFRTADYEIPRSDWYKSEKGFKAEVVTYTISLLRHVLLKNNKDINLSKIFKDQKISSSLSEFIVELGKTVREKITDPDFRDGIANPSEFCKSEKGWLKFKELDVDISKLDPKDILDKDQITESKKEKKEVNETSKVINDYALAMTISEKEWQFISEFNAPIYGAEHKNVRLPQKCIGLLKPGSRLSEKQVKEAIKIRESAYANGFDFID